MMSIQLYIEKKDYNKLKNVLKELESDENEVKHGTYIFAKIIGVLGEGIKWNSINIIEQMCQELNDSDDFEILFYIKIFRFIYDNKINDIFLLSIILEKYCEKYGVDLNLAYAVIHTESGFDSDAVSSLGACGLMQIMPETFDWLRSKDSECSERYSDIFDPETNIRYGLLFLSIIGQRFDSERLVIAAYHAGMGRVSSWLDDSSFSSDGVSLHTIPFSDTEYYVKKVERTKRIYEVLYPAGS